MLLQRFCCVVGLALAIFGLTAESRAAESLRYDVAVYGGTAVQLTFNLTD